MIIFYNKDTGKIKGTIEGRIHANMDLNQWVGKRDETDRIIIEWEKDETGEYKPINDDLEQIKILEIIDKNPTQVYDYYVDLKSKKLVKK